MGKSFAKIAFTPLVKQQQTLHGSRTAYDRVEQTGPPGNLQHDDRVSLFLMDYPSQSRLKILGHATIHEGPEAATLIQQLRSPQEKDPIERAIVIHVDAFDWNCPQHITPRYTEEQIVQLTTPIRQRIADLEAENKRLRAQLAEPAKS
jgi:hypothetical protein